MKGIISAMTIAVTGTVIGVGALVWAIFAAISGQSSSTTHEIEVSCVRIAENLRPDLIPSQVSAICNPKGN